MDELNKIFQQETGIDIDRCFYNIANQIRVIENAEKIKDYTNWLKSKIKNLGESSSWLSAVSGCCADRYSHIKSWNIELYDDGIYACTNEHDKGDKCNYQKLSNNELHEIIEYLRNGR